MPNNTAITARDAYYKGRRCSAEFADDALDKFSRKYCAHVWSGTCDLCNAWQNGYDRQLEVYRHEHIKACPAGYAACHDECE